MTLVNEMTKVRAAAHECLQRCVAGPKTPLATLADALEELAESPSWDCGEIEIVRHRVLRLLDAPHFTLYGRNR